MAGRMKKGAKAAAQADLARGLPAEEVMARHGIRSRRTLKAWQSDAKAAESKSGASTEGAAGEPPPGAPPVDGGAPDPRQMGDSEAVLFLLRFGVAFTTKSAGMVVGFAPTSPLVQLQSKLTPDEEEMVRACAPSLLPAFKRFCEWMDKHGVAVFAMLFASMMLPRAITLGMAAKEIRKRERETNKPHRTEPRGESEPAAAARAAEPTAPRNGAPLSLYPKNGSNE
jgi:hypothetical protein